MKQNISETESNWRFQKNVKTCLQNKKSYLIPPSRDGYFHRILILPVKMVESYRSNMQIQLSIGCKHCYYQLPIVAKNSILNMAEFPDLSLKTPPCMKTNPVSCENQSFFLLF